MITKPFNFEAHVTAPPAGLDLIPFVNVCALVLFFGLFGSRFILAPGTALKLDLPATAGPPPDAMATSQVLTVSEIDGREMLIFDGRILNLASLERRLAEHADEFRGQVLLLRMDRDVSTQLILRVAEIVARAGFTDVLLAAEPEQAQTTGGGG